jgi:hypothetical protein
LIRSRARALSVAAAILLVALAVAGCGRHQATIPPTAPATASTFETGGPTGSIDPSASAGLDSSPAEPSATDRPGPTAPDPAASELDQINQLINDINNSIQDSSSGGGE